VSQELRWTALLVVLLFGSVGCGQSNSTGSANTQTAKKKVSNGEPPGKSLLSGEIKVDGSSTVYLITEKIATNFKRQHPGVNITVGISGTGGGFKKFAAGETDISDASRAIRPAEAEACKKNGIAYLELQVAWDGLAVVVNKENTWAKEMTVEQLKKIWHPETKDFKNAKKWSDVNGQWPNEDIKLFGPGADSGTFDYFTEAINGKEKVSRTDYEDSEDDNIIVKGVERSRYALGYFGVAYYEAHKDKLSVVAIASKEGAPYVLPTRENVLTNKYKPLSRPLYIYVKTSSLKRPEVAEFLKYYLRRDDLVADVKYVPLSAEQQVEQQQKLEKALANQQ
jgi:phosphate transport system substrate-binding protein